MLLFLNLRIDRLIKTHGQNINDLLQKSLIGIQYIPLIFGDIFEILKILYIDINISIKV